MQTIHRPLRTTTSDDIQVSFFKPTPEELESLIMGGGVEVQFRTTAHQNSVVSVSAWPAITAQIGNDPFIKHSTGFQCCGCCAKVGLPHARHCVEVARA